MDSKVDTGTKILIAVGVGTAALGIGFLLYSVIKNKKAQNENLDNTNIGGNRGFSIGTKISVGDNLYPSGNTVNIRDEARVDDFFPSTLIKKDHIGLIGSVLSEVKGVEDGLTWYKVKLAQPIQSFTSYGLLKTYTEGYVRSDVVKKG